MTFVIEDAAWDVLPTEGSEIAAFDKEGNMVGSTITLACGSCYCMG